MHGFKKGVMPKPQHLANGGIVKGAGTGTSDSIKTKVAAGSYIMPADSTQKISAPSLGALGFSPQSKVPVNLSDGEYEMPPEQVHAVGVQALDKMKEQTHTPVNQPQVQQGKGFKPEMFFADGGSVWDKVKQYGANQFPRSVATNAQVSQDMQKNEDAGNYAGAAGSAVAGAVKLAGSGVADLTAPIFDGVNRFGAGLVGADQTTSPSPSVASSWPKPTTSAVKTVPNPMAEITSPSLGFKPQATASSAEDAATQEATTPLANNVTRVGNSFSGTGSIGQGFTVNGKSTGFDKNGSTTPYDPKNSGNVAAMSQLMKGTPEFGQGQPVTTPTAAGFNANAYQASQFNAAQILNARRQESNQLRQNELRMIAPYSGSGGKLTVSQQAARQGLINGMSANDMPQYLADTNTAAGLQKQAMGDQAAIERTAMQENGATSRNETNNSTDLTKFGATNDLANRQYNDGADARGFASQQARRMSKVLAQYDAAKSPEERKALSEQLQQLNGKDQPNRYTVVPGGQEIDPITQQLRTVPSRVLSNETGQFIGQPSAAQPHPEGTKLTGKDGKAYVVKNGVPVLA